MYLSIVSSQNQQLLQLLRNCLHDATAILTSTVLPPYKASSPTCMCTCTCTFTWCHRSNPYLAFLLIEQMH